MGTAQHNGDNMTGSDETQERRSLGQGGRRGCPSWTPAKGGGEAEDALKISIEIVSDFLLLIKYEMHFF